MIKAFIHWWKNRPILRNRLLWTLVNYGPQVTLDLAGMEDLKDFSLARVYLELGSMKDAGLVERRVIEGCRRNRRIQNHQLMWSLTRDGVDVAKRVRRVW